MMRPDLSIQGIDVLVRDKINFPVKPFDGRQIPFQDSSFEFVVLIDVLHHLVDPSGLLREAIRVSSRAVLIKDHVLKGILAAPILRFMDRIGNLRYAVSLPYTYWPQQRWLRTFETLGVKLAWWNQSLGLYPWPANLVFERSLHFMARLDKDEPK
jgi:SAM-dependent methyltransferase